jgi:glycolate oxidase iron-sulfur subunit
MSEAIELPARTAAPAQGTHLLRAWRAAESHCIKCGFCLPACPTYVVTGLESASPRGRLDLLAGVARGRLTIDQIEAPLRFCLGCLACETACPSGIRFRDLLEAGRTDAAEGPDGKARGGSWRQALLLNQVLLFPRRLKALAWAVYWYQQSWLPRLVRASRLLTLLAPNLATLERQAPPLRPPLDWRRQVRAWLRAEGPLDAGRDGGAGADGKRATLFTGCVMDVLFGGVHAATVKVLHVNGFAVTAPAAQTCCGALHLHLGRREEARALARRNIAAFEPLGEAPLVVNSAGCGALLKDYAGLLADDPAWAERARRFSARVRDVCELLAETELVPPTESVPFRLAYDDPCHLVHAQKIREAPRKVLRSLPDLELVPLPEADWCCGSAGSYSLQHPEMAARLLERKMRHIVESRADAVASGNPGCLLQIRLGAHERNVLLRVAHPVEFLALGYR